MITLLFSALSELGSQWLSNKKEKSAAKHTQELKKIEQDGAAETSLIAQMATSWKDEYWTVVISAPVLAIIYAVAVNDPEIIGRVREGMQALETMPVWFQAMLSVAVLTSFGVKVKNNIFQTK